MAEMLIFLSVEGGGLAILKESAVTFFYASLNVIHLPVNTF